jgi:hypothetical protein
MIHERTGSGNEWSRETERPIAHNRTMSSTCLLHDLTFPGQAEIVKWRFVAWENIEVTLKAATTKMIL